jgi:hypothetical protein
LFSLNEDGFSLFEKLLLREALNAQFLKSLLESLGIEGDLIGWGTEDRLYQLQQDGHFL